MNTRLIGVPDKTHVAAITAMIKTNPVAVVVIPVLQDEGDGRYSWSGKFNMRAKGVEASAEGMEFTKMILSGAVESIEGYYDGNESA